MAKPKKIRWRSLVGFMATVRRQDGRTLAISTLSPDGTEWIAQAAETGSDPESMQAVFDDHGHADLGTFDSLTDARAECEHYALHWREGDGDVIPACECEDIPIDELEPLVIETRLGNPRFRHDD